MINLSNVTNFPNMYVGMRICVDLCVREFPPFEGYFFLAADNHVNIERVE